jgi:hypothetical protein
LEIQFFDNSFNFSVLSTIQFQFNFWQQTKKSFSDLVSNFQHFLAILFFAFCEKKKRKRKNVSKGNSQVNFETASFASFKN